MLRPVIFVGCGGSGTKAIRYVRDAVQRRLEHQGWDRGMPAAWQFIGLDTLTVQESPTEIPTVPASDFLSLSATFDTYRGLQSALKQRYPVGRTDRGASVLCGWLPDPRSVNIPLKDGAGQNRGIGRAAGLVSLEGALRERLKTAFNRASAGGPELKELGPYLGVDAEVGGETAAPIVAVCSSMAGGTGAGVVLDVVDLVRACDPAGGHPALVLFTNDIFDLPDSRPMAANALGLMSEMLAAYWSRPGEIQSPLALNNAREPKVGPHSVFLVGRHSHSGADLGETAEVYRAVGEALSTWVVDDAVQERIHNFINVNWQNSAVSNGGGYPFGKEYQYGVISSFGAAKVTVGRDRFAHWAEHLLSRQILESLADGHMRLNRLAETANNATERETIAALGQHFGERIFAARRLDPRLRNDEPAGCAAAVQAYAPDDEVREVRAQVLRDLALPAGQKAPAHVWRDQLARMGGAASDEFEAEAKQRDDAKWNQQMLDATCSAVSQLVALSSLRVAAAALDHIASEIAPTAVNRARKLARADADQYAQLVRSGLDSLAGIDGDLAGDAPQVLTAAENIAQGVARFWRSLRRQAAADAIHAAREQVFGSIRNELMKANQQVGFALSEDDVKTWPTGVDDIAKRYLPSSVELPLESHAVWPALLADLCAEAHSGGLAFGNRPTDPLRYTLIAGEEDVRPIVQVGEHHRWQPGQYADVRCDVTDEDVLERVHAWTRQPGSKFNRIVTEGLRSYLAESDSMTGARRVDHSARMEVFREQLGNATQAADPLVQIDQDLYSVTNDQPLEPFLTVCSQFPFAEGHPAEETARMILGESSYIASLQDTSSVLVSSYIRNPMYPMAVRSFTAPITNALTGSRTPEQRSSEFWMWRRSRTLEGFLPLPRESLKAMIAGFAVARLCGYVTVDPSQPIRISLEQGDTTFPWPLLTTLRDRDELLAALLEAFCLTFGTVASEGMPTYDAYRRLYELGLPSLRRQLPPDLEHLVDTGITLHSTVADERPKATGETSEIRREAAIAYLDANLEHFRKHHPDRMDSHLVRGLDGRADAGAMTTELAPLYIDCYETLKSLLPQRPVGTVI